MSFYRQSQSLPRRFRLVLASFLQRPGLPFADALSEDAIQKAFDDEEASFADDEDAVYTPCITLWAFLSQVLFKDEQRSCVAAVARVAVLLVALAREPCSHNTGAYCRARGKLSEIDFVTRVHQRRQVDFRRGRRLGRSDRVVTWSRPQRPDWMDQQTHDRMQASIKVRAIRVRVRQPGFRSDSFIVVSTLTDAEEYPKNDIADLYHRRWMAELDIRAIKITMGMDILRCRTPEMVRKEMWACLLAYNLIRRTMLQSAQKAGVSPRALSFTAAMQSIAASWMVIALCNDSVAADLIESALANLRNHIIGHRPGRVEPRAVKRRPKPHDLLTKPRAQARAELLKEKSL